MSTERRGYYGPSVFQGQSQIEAVAKVAWWTKFFTSIPAAGRTLLEDSSDVPTDQVLTHVLAMRDKVFAI